MYKSFLFEFKETRCVNNYIQLSGIVLLNGNNSVIPLRKATNPMGKSPYNEQSNNVIDVNDLSTKWLDFKMCTNGQSRLLLECSVPSGAPAVYTFVTANDAPDRDPASWNLYGVLQTDVLVLIDERNGESPPEERWCPVDYRVTSDQQQQPSIDANAEKNTGEENGENLIRYLRFEFSGTAESNEFIQLACISFFDTNDQPVPVSNVDNPNGNSPYSERAPNLRDQSPYTKWLDRRMQYDRTSELIITLVYACELGSYSFTTANDFPGRDPGTWLLYGKGENHQWSVLDRRVNHVLPLERYCESERIHFNNGNTENGESGEVEVNDRHLDPPTLRRLKSDALSDVWTSQDLELCPEYAQVAESIIVEREIMQSSVLQIGLKKLEPLIDSHNLDFSRALSECVAFAYDCQVSEARSVWCMLTGYNLFHSVRQFYDAFGWRQKYITVAIIEMTRVAREAQDASGLVGILSMMGRAGRECKARKYMVFRALVLNCTSLSMSHDASSAHLDARGGLYDFLVDFIDTYKSKAFASAFLEPTQAHFNRVGDRIMEGDVEVHGSNMYALLLMSTLGVQLSINPYMRDEPKGFCNFLDSTSEHFNQLVDALLLPEHFGRSWKTLPRKFRNWGWSSGDGVQRNFLYVSKSNVLEMANALVDPSPRAANVRHRIVPYLQRFASLFHADYILEKLFIKCIGEDGRPALMQRVFDEYRITRQIDEEDVRMWVYDEDFKFHPDCAQDFFAFVGVVKRA